MFRPPQHPLPTESLPQGRERWLGPLLGAGEGANWIGTLQKHISCSSLEEGGGGGGGGEAADCLCDDGSQPQPPCSHALTWSSPASAHPEPS